MHNCISICRDKCSRLHYPDTEKTKQNNHENWNCVPMCTLCRELLQAEMEEPETKQGEEEEEVFDCLLGTFRPEDR